MTWGKDLFQFSDEREGEDIEEDKDDRVKDHESLGFDRLHTVKFDLQENQDEEILEKKTSKRSEQLLSYFIVTQTPSLTVTIFYRHMKICIYAYNFKQIPLDDRNHSKTQLYHRDLQIIGTIE